MSLDSKSKTKHRDSIAVLSDVHSNLEAFTATLREIQKLGISKIYSLGDGVGYGPDPVECTKLAEENITVRIMGNHEYAIRFPDTLRFNRDAQAAADWTRGVLEVAGVLDKATELPMSYQEGDVLFVHGSVKGHIMDYVFSEDRDGYSTFDAIAQTLEESFVGFRLCFVGHNHTPFLATEEGFLHPHAEVDEFYVAGRKLYVCVGSVGQPRDGDNRASFVVYNGETVKYHRVPYDVATTAAKIRKNGLPERLADRLLVGR